jgi:2'-5' RNA ligase superfamily
MPDETKFEVDSLWAKPCRTYHVRHEPDQATIRQITELQDQIEATAARELLRVPAHSLHITVLTLFPAAANVAAPDDALWSQHNETWLERIGDVCAATHPFAVEFDSIRASRAIILRGDESANLNYFREKLITAVSLPGWEADTAQYRPYIPFSVRSFQTSVRNVGVDSSVRFCHENFLKGCHDRPRVPVPIFGTYFSTALHAGLVAGLASPREPGDGQSDAI